ncbi:heavy metal translocating P-type ATPase ['Camptotheca acuminata' phytoplasma]|uniref:heavy metal translocating P-type ATPase n=1 Tax='Camptotheca acuminata' phytoplasma TaxID=3239192 RepID=UPI00351A5D91
MIENIKEYKDNYFDSKSQSQKYVYFFLFGVLIYLIFFIPINIFYFDSDFFSISFKDVLPWLTLLILFLTGFSVFKEVFYKMYEDTKKNKKLILNVNILMTLSALGSFYLSKFNESILLIIIFGGSHFLEDYIENKNKKDIQNLLKIQPQKAKLLKENNNFKLVDVYDLKIGDKVLVLNGEQIPSDGIIISGSSSIDESTITGESIPVDKKEGDKVFGSNINLTQTLTIEVTATAEETVFFKIIHLTNKIQQNVSKKASLIKKIESIYVKYIILITSVIIFLGFVLSHECFGLGWEFENIFYKSIVFLTIGSPCALTVADIPATLSSISHLSKKGVLLKNSQSLSVLSEINAIAFDKTGTLTKGEIEVQDVLFISDITEEQKLKYLNILLFMEQKSNHPISVALQKYFKDKLILDPSLKLKVTNLIGIGISSQDQEGSEYKIFKYNYFKELVVSSEIKYQTEEFLDDGNTVIYFSHNDNVMMIIAVKDEIRQEAKGMIKYFNQNRIITTMLTGDNEKVASFIGTNLGLNKIFFDCLPEEKSEYITNIKEEYQCVAMVGDGVNDSPALVNSDVSITLKGGSDVANDIADIVLVKNDLNKIIYTHKVSKKLNKIVWQNIIFAISIMAIFSIFNFLAKLPLTFAVVLHEGSTLLVIFNCLRLRNNISDYEH